MGDSYVKTGSSWRQVNTPYVKVSGTWRPCTNVYVKVSGTWREVFTGSPQVSPRADGDSNLVLDFGTVTCHQGCDFETNGNEYENTPEGAQTNGTVWLDGGSASEVWVEFVRTAGSQTKWDSHNSSQRYQLNVNQRFGMSVTSTSGSNQKTLTGYFRMWDAASGGNVLWTGSTVEWSCTATVQTGPCSTC